MQLAALEGEGLVDNALRCLIASESLITEKTVQNELLAVAGKPEAKHEVNIMPVSLLIYDSLLPRRQEGV